MSQIGFLFQMSTWKYQYNLTFLLNNGYRAEHLSAKTGGK